VVTIDGAKTYPTDGSLGITTVYELGAPGSRLTFFQAFRGWIDPAEAVVPREFLYPDDAFNDDNAGDQFRRQGAAQMAESEQNAIVAGLNYADEPVTYQVVITDVEPDAPASGSLEPGDTILEINGSKVGNYRDIKRIMGKVEPGGTVEVTVERDDATLTEEITTGANPDDETRAYLGVLLGLGFDSPVQVDLRLDDVGGPSAGLMFSLAIVDSLTPDSLTGGRAVAGTGTITPQGKVGAIGGVVQKMYGARDSGAEFFLAPRSNCREIAGNIPSGLDVAAVRTLEDAVSVIDGSGQDEECPAP
jgi:PDZ domain-containing protein